MADAKCPGQNPQYWKPEDAVEVQCPQCKEIVEFFKDEPKRKCYNCKHEVINPKVDFGCALWCPKAVECIGQERYQQLLASAQQAPAGDKYRTKKDLLVFEMERYFGKDAKSIAHAKKVLSFAEQLLEKEKAAWAMGSPTTACWPADPLVVIAAAILHDIGICKAKEKHGSHAAKYQEIEGPAVAREMMEKIQLKKEAVDEVCAIIAHHHSPKEAETLNFKVLYDADWLVNFKDEYARYHKEEVSEVIERVFLTKSGKELARELYILPK